MEGNKIFKASEDSYKSQWKLRGRTLMLCVRSLPRCVCVNVFTYLFGVVVLLCACHACAGRECDACHRQFENGPAEWWHSTWASGIWAKTGHISFGKRPRAAGTENQRSLFFPGCIHATLLFHVWSFFKFIHGHKPPGHLIEEGSQYCMKSRPSVFISISSSFHQPTNPVRDRLHVTTCWLFMFVISL